MTQPPPCKWSIHFPVLYPAGLARRLLRENPHWPQSIPFEMVDERHHDVTRLFGYGHVIIARSGGLTPQALVSLFDDLPTEETAGLTFAESVARVMFHVQQWTAERAARQSSTDTEGQ